MLSRFYRSLCAVTLSMVLAGCSLPTASPPQPSTPLAPTAAETPTSQPTAPVLAPSQLTVCLGQQPNSLYPLAIPNSAARSVLSAIYDGPVDAFANGSAPVILERLPSIENRDAQVASVSVKRGAQVIDAQGNLAVLDLGVNILPSGCYDQNCAVAYDGRGDVKMDQMIVTFRLLPGLLWSDGEPLTAEDSVYAYTLAADPASPNSKYIIDRTQSYESADELTTQWWGKPGFVDPTYVDNFFAPLPRHAWSALSAAQLATAELAQRPAIGWGAYVFDEWVPGQFIRLSKNPNYFRAPLGLPHFQNIVFKFLPNAENAIAALVAGECDVLDPSLRLEGQLALLTEMERSDQIDVEISATPLIERLEFGIRPASYEDGFSIPAGDRPDFFADVRTRQAVAYCLDRAKVVSDVLQNYTEVPNTYLPSSNALYNDKAASYPYDPVKGAQLLLQAGWVDDDNNPATPLKAQTVIGVPPGTSFIIDYATTTATQRRQTAEILVQSLARCGIQANPRYVSPSELFAPGPNGPLFGRQFDLVAYAMGTSSTEPPCDWFTTRQIPTAANRWIGVNVSGYSNPDYNLLCQRAARLTPENPAYPATHAQLQEIFANDLPSIPLYFRIKVAVARPDFCNLNIESTSFDDAWNIEEWNYGALCAN